MCRTWSECLFKTFEQHLHDEDYIDEKCLLISVVLGMQEVFTICIIATRYYFYQFSDFQQFVLL